MCIDRAAEALQFEPAQRRGLDGLRYGREHMWPDQDLPRTRVPAEPGGEVRHGPTTP